MIRILQGDCRDVLKTLPDNSVHCCVTSPPYYGLRDYGTAQWDGGDPKCDHFVGEIRTGLGLAALGERYRGGGHKQGTVEKLTARSQCPKCGARRIDAQIGLEQSPDEYVAQLVAVFREVRRVLRDDGTLWLNLGDSYNAARNGGHPGGKNSGFQQVDERYAPRSGANVEGLAAKQLLMMPARVALALQADGWYLRSDIIWHKPNPMPESVTDRPTSSYEHVFLLAKSPRYFFDAEAMKEASVGMSEHDLTGQGYAPPGQTPQIGNRKPLHAATYERHRSSIVGGQSLQAAPDGTRNIRNVWTIATAPYPDAHFATFPPELAERCIKAGTSGKGCCANCGAPWVRQTNATYVKSPAHGDGSVVGRHYKTGANGWDGSGLPRLNKQVETTGWSPSCQCKVLSGTDAERGEVGTVPCTVLDPFAGAFTAPMVADRLQRHAVGIELSEAYVKLARNRLAADAGMFAEITD